MVDPKSSSVQLKKHSFLLVITLSQGPVALEVVPVAKCLEAHGEFGKCCHL